MRALIVHDSPVAASASRTLDHIETNSTQLRLNGTYNAFPSPPVSWAAMHGAILPEASSTRGAVTWRLKVHSHACIEEMLRVIASRDPSSRRDRDKEPVAALQFERLPRAVPNHQVHLVA